MEQVFYATIAQSSQESGSNPTGGASAQGCQQMGGMLVPMLLMFVIIYLMIIRPQQKQQKQHRALLSALKKGDKVITNSGIYGTITGIADNNVLTLEIAKNVHIRMLRGQIAGLQPGEQEEARALPSAEAKK